VCQIQSDNHHVHYGALACFSCRAFFRRAHSKARGPTYVCKKDSDCDITAKNRKKCQKCRYDKCLASGMNPVLVLNDDQKKVRFRKSIEKKGSNTTGGGGAGGAGGTVSEAVTSNRLSAPTMGGLASSPSFSGREQRKRTSSAPSGERRRSQPPSLPGSTVSDDEEDVPSDLARLLGASDSEILQGKFSGRKIKEETLNAPAAATPMPGLLRIHAQGGGGDNSGGTRGQSSSQNISGGGLNEGDIKQEILNEFGLGDMKQPSPTGSDLAYGVMQQQQPPATADGGPGWSVPSFGPSFQVYNYFYQHPETKQPQQQPQQQQAENFQALRILQHQQQQQFQAAAAARSSLATAQSAQAFGQQQQNHQSLQPQTSFPNCSSSSPSSTSFPSTLFVNGDDAAAAPSSRFTMTFEGMCAVVKAYHGAVSEIPLSQETSNRLVAMHCSGSGSGDQTPMQKSDFRKMVLCVADRFRLFAMRLPCFQLLPFTDQRELLMKNITLYVQYILAQYFGAKDGEDQLKWVLGDDFRDSIDPPVGAARKVGLPSFSRKVGLFRSTADTGTYETLSSQVSNLGLQPFHNPLVAVLLLLAQTESTKLEDSLTVQGIGEAFLEFVSDREASMTFHFKRDSLESLFDVMHVVAKFYAQNIFFEGLNGDVEKEMAAAAAEHENDDGSKKLKSSDGSSSRAVMAPTHLEMPYTVEEEAWLRSNLDKFRSAYNEVSLGEEYVNEFVMFSYDVPLSKHFVPNEISAFAERGRRIMKIHPEFTSLADSQQMELCRANCHKAAALCSVKSETFSTGSEQLLFNFGKEDSRDA
jgi:hypothetical protein